MAFREDYFVKLNRKSAYVLGLIFSDGCIQFYKDKPRTVNIYSKDILVLEQILADMGIEDGKIHKGIGPTWYIRIYSAKMCRDLMELGVVRRKKEEWKDPVVPGRLMRHWMRGYFEGMGNVSWEKRAEASYRVATFIFAHRYEGILFVQDWLMENGLTRVRVLRREGGRYHIRYKMKNSIQLLEMLYRGATIFRSDIKQKVEFCFGKLQEAQADELDESS